MRSGFLTAQIKLFLLLLLLLSTGATSRSGAASWTEAGVWPYRQSPKSCPPTQTLWKLLQRFHRARRASAPCRSGRSCPSSWSAPPTRCSSLPPCSNRSPPSWLLCPRERRESSRGRRPTRGRTVQVRVQACWLNSRCLNLFCFVVFVCDAHICRLQPSALKALKIQFVNLRRLLFFFSFFCCCCPASIDVSQVVPIRVTGKEGGSLRAKRNASPQRIYQSGADDITLHLMRFVPTSLFIW